MADEKKLLVKYVFMDIVGYTKNRSDEAQSKIIGYQNRIVLGALEAEKISDEDRILLPTGDGMCIALIGADTRFDIEIRLALEILSRLTEHNSTATDPEHRFELRIGLNHNYDNRVTDINGRSNVAGKGINMAQRVMSKGEAGHVLLGESVYATLEGSRDYMQALRGYDSLTKHGKNIRVYQYYKKNVPGLNCEAPPALTKPTAAFPKLRLFELSK